VLDARYGLPRNRTSVRGPAEPSDRRALGIHLRRRGRLTNAAIVDQVIVTEATVKWHVKQILGNS
jgi:DNA-binding NarL/FixJ family response regulator